MAKKKKARRMPAHIVLPNGMWRFVKRGSKARSSARRIKTRAITKRPKRSGFVMARRRRRVSRRRSGPKIGGFNLMRGIIPVRGIVASAIIGVGASMLAQRFAPQVLPQQNLIIAGAVGGLPGAAAAYFLGGAGAVGGLGSGGITYY